MSLFGSSGIRGIADARLIHLAVKVGLSLSAGYKSVVLGNDSRTSSPALKYAVISGLLSGGARCADAGLLPTPTLALASRNFEAGVMITASHNPPEYNGLKLLNPDGSAFDATQRRQIEELVLGDAFASVSWHEMKDVDFYPNAIEEHIKHILKSFPDKVKCKVVVDCVCGAASVITPYLLRELGCEVIALNAYPSGFFPHQVEPKEANFGDLIKATREFGADLGIAHDGDADRIMVVDDKGRFVPGDKLLGVFAKELKAREVITTVDASMCLEEMGFSLKRTKVGDIYVSEELKKGGDFGGEPSGSWVFPESSLCPDGIYAAAQIVDIASRRKLSDLVDNMPSYPIRRGNVSLQGIRIDGLKEVLGAMQPVSISNTDGVKLNFEDGWLLVRASGTEPKVRLTVEARDVERTNKLYDKALRVIEGLRGEWN